MVDTLWQIISCMNSNIFAVYFTNGSIAMVTDLHSVKNKQTKNPITKSKQKSPKQKLKQTNPSKNPNQNPQLQT